jgi:hypothetical protein
MPTSEWSAITGKKSEAPTVKSDISMPRSALERELSQAEEHVVKDPDRIAHQRAVVSRHEDEGLDSAIARAVLKQLEILQRIHIADRDRLLVEAKDQND